MLQLLKNLRSHSVGKEITDADILNWANDKVNKAGKEIKMDSFKVREYYYLKLQYMQIPDSYIL